MKRIAARDDPLTQMRNEEREKQLNESGEQAEAAEAKDANDAQATITHKLGQHDPLADFHKLEVMMLNRTEFETWDSKKLKIFAQFKL